MLKPLRLACLPCIALCILYIPTYSQDSSSLYSKVYSFPDKFFRSVNDKSEKLQRRLEKSTEKYLSQLSRREKKLQRKLAKKDSAAAAELFGDVNARYDSLRNTLMQPAGKLQNVYSGHLDSMGTALNFLQQNKILNNSGPMQGKLQSVFRNYGGVQEKFNQGHFIEEQLKERQQMLKSRLQSFGLGKELDRYQQKVYYYRAQMEAYKNIFEQPEKMESLLLKVANKIPAFSQFFDKYSQLAGLFRLPGNDDVAIGDINGLQTRGMLLQELEQRMGTGPNMEQYMGSSMMNAQSDLEKIKDKVSQLGSAGGDMDMPDFRPNQQKTKTFLQRIEFGTNIQSTKGSSFLPVTSDIGLSAGYKLNPRSVIGVGASYRMGWGQDIRHIRVSHQGAGLRSFVDWQLKKTYWLSGGFEMNYNAVFRHVDELKNVNAWQQSGLLGISKKLNVHSKYFKNTNMQLLWDFLSYRQVPRTSPVKFRFGYSF